MPPQTSTNPPPSPPIRSFAIIWTGQAGSILGSQLVQFGLIWWLARTTGSATILAWAGMMGLLPQIFLGPFAGTLVDRWNRRRVLIVADGAIALATLLLAGLYSLEVVQFWHIYGLLFIRAVGGAFHWPAMQASTTLMVPEKDLPRVGGLNQTLFGLTGIFVPPLGALAVEVLAMQTILAIDVATALLAIIPLLFIPIPQPARTETAAAPPSIWGEMRAGFTFVWRWPGLLLFSAIGMISNLLGGAAAALRPILVTDHFGGGPLELGWMQSAAGLGAVLGGLTLGLWGGFRQRVMTVMLALALDGLAITSVGLISATAFPLVLPALFMVGFLEAIVVGMNGAIFQAAVPPHMQGRVFALLISLAQIAAPVGLAIAGPVADAFGVQIWWLLAGLVITTMGGGALFVPAIRRLEQPAG